MYTFHRTTKEALVLIARHSDPSFVRSFLAFNTEYKFATREVVAAVRCANNRQDCYHYIASADISADLEHHRRVNEKSKFVVIMLSVFLIRKLVIFFMNQSLLHELNYGNKFNFENVPRFDEVWTREPPIDLLLECLSNLPFI